MKTYDTLTLGWTIVTLDTPITDETSFPPVSRVVDHFMDMGSGVVFQVDRRSREYRFTPTPSHPDEKVDCRKKPFIPWPA